MDVLYAPRPAEQAGEAKGAARGDEREKAGFAGLGTPSQRRTSVRGVPRTPRVAAGTAALRYCL